jgi:hypothetical protein
MGFVVRRASIIHISWDDPPSRHSSLRNETGRRWRLQDKSPQGQYIDLRTDAT